MLLRWWCCWYDTDSQPSLFGHFNAKHDLASALSTEICISCLLIKYVYAKVCITVGAYYMHKHYKNAMLWYSLHYVWLQFTLLIIYRFSCPFPKEQAKLHVPMHTSELQQIFSQGPGVWSRRLGFGLAREQCEDIWWKNYTPSRLFGSMHDLYDREGIKPRQIRLARKF